jgi:hypothetical protein
VVCRFDEHDRLVAVGERQPAAARSDSNRDPEKIRAASPQDYQDWAAEQRVFQSIAAIASGATTLREVGAEPEDLPSQRVASGFFDVLRVRPPLARVFTSDNEVAGRHRVVVLSDALWRRRFGRDPAIIGRTIRLDDGAYEVAGIMPPDFVFPVGAARPTALWVPYVVGDDERVRTPTSKRWYLQRRRAVARASNRFVTFAHAIRSTMATAPSTITSQDFVRAPTQ